MLLAATLGHGTVAAPFVSGAAAIITLSSYAIQANCCLEPHGSYTIAIAAAALSTSAYTLGPLLLLLLLLLLIQNNSCKWQVLTGDHCPIFDHNLNNISHPLYQSTAAQLSHITHTYTTTYHTPCTLPHTTTH